MDFAITHAKLSVADLEKSLEFYRRAFGFNEVRRMEASDGSSVTVFLCGKNPDGFQLELNWQRDKTGPYDLGDNESHIGFVAEDAEAARKLHEEMGVVTREWGPLYFVSDPDGYCLEIIPKRK